EQIEPVECVCFHRHHIAAVRLACMGGPALTPLTPVARTGPPTHAASHRAGAPQHADLGTPVPTPSPQSLARSRPRMPLTLQHAEAGTPRRRLGVNGAGVGCLPRRGTKEWGVMDPECGACLGVDEN